jgi:Icc-related predicted phosphoesterase
MAFNLNRGSQLAEKWEKISSDCDILITHSPPYGILDECVNGRRVGCEELRRFHDEGLISPRLHVFGHIHEQHGECVLLLFSHFVTSSVLCSSFVGYQRNGKTLFVNAASCDVGYKPVHKPIVVFLPFDKSLPAEVVTL